MSPQDLLPGLYVLLLGASLAAALRRWYDPVPARVLAGFGLLLAVLFGPCLVGGKILLPLANLVSAPPFHGEGPAPLGNWLQGDLVHQITPWLLEVRRAVFAGRWPLWNPHMGAGMPLLGDPQSQSFHPLVVAAYPFPLMQAAVVTASLRVLLALVFTFLFLRRQSLGEAAALCGSLAYGLGGFLLIWLGWPIGNVAALLPVVLYAVARCDEPGTRRDHLLLFLAAAALLIGGHPETVLYSAALAGLLLLARALGRRGARGMRGRARTERNCLSPQGELEHRPQPVPASSGPGGSSGVLLLARSGLALLLAGLAAAPSLLLAREYLPQTQRAHLVQTHLVPFSPSEVWHGLRKPETLASWGRFAEGRLLPVAAPRAYGHYHEWWGAVNIIEDASGFPGTVAAFAGLAALLPFARRRFPQERLAAGVLLVSLFLLAQPPGFANLFIRLPVVGVTATHQHHRILLPVCFLLAWLAACEVERWRGGERRLPVALAAAALAGLLAWSYLAHPSPRGKILWADLGVQGAALALAAGLLLARPAQRASWAPWALAAVVAGELLWMHLPSNPPMPARLGYPAPAPVRFLQRAQGDFRMVGLGNTFLPNIPTVYGLRDARVDNPSGPAAYVQLTRPLSRSDLVPRFGRPGHPLYDLLGVRWVMARPGVRLPFRLAFRDPAGWIYERPRPLPLVFLPARARMYRGGDWTSWVHANTDFAARALVLPSPERHRHWRSRRPAASRAGIVSLEPARVRVRASLAEPRLLATSLFQDGNWLLLAGGEPRPTVVANGPLLAAWLPEGGHEVELIYRPRALLAGCLLSALAFTAAVVWWVPRPRFPVS